MKKNILLLGFVVISSITFQNCKKCEEPIVGIQNYLFDGLDVNTKLPVSDTTNAFAYVSGEIEGVPFSLVDGKEGFEFIDYASAFFTRPFSTDSAYFRKSGVSSAWHFQTKRDSNKFWRVWLNLPSFLPKSATEFNQYKRDFTTPVKVFELFDSGVEVDNPNFTISKAMICIIREDFFKVSGVLKGDQRIVSTGSLNVSQSNSFLKLVSVTKHPTIVNNYYLYELHYEFECNFNNGSRDIRLSKGKAKVWVRDIIY
jgi:hypothetical protein